MNAFSATEGAATLRRIYAFILDNANPDYGRIDTWDEDDWMARVADVLPVMENLDMYAKDGESEHAPYAFCDDDIAGIVAYTFSEYGTPMSEILQMGHERLIAQLLKLAHDNDGGEF